MAAKAPLGILVCGDLSLEKFKGFWVQDCAAAVQNMLLAAHGLGLGAVWTGIHPLGEREDRFRAQFELPEHVIPFALVVIGHPAQASEAKNRYKKDRVHYETW
jgi:nitroreductase